MYFPDLIWNNDYHIHSIQFSCAYTSSRISYSYSHRFPFMWIRLSPRKLVNRAEKSKKAKKLFHYFNGNTCLRLLNRIIFSGLRRKSQRANSANYKFSFCVRCRKKFNLVHGYFQSRTFIALWTSYFCPLLHTGKWYELETC